MIEDLKSMKKRDKIIIASVVVGGVVFGGYTLAKSDKEEIPTATDITITDVVQTTTNLTEEKTAEELLTSIQEKSAEPEKTESVTTSTVLKTSEYAPTAMTSKNSENHFNDYNNPEQQNTTQYILNTDSFKVHLPSCNDVKKIKPENYSTTTDLDWAKSQGYTACGHCHPF